MSRDTILARLHPRRSWSVLVVVALIATTLFFVFRSDGNIVPELDLHDAGIWVSNEAAGQVGRTNTEIATVDTRLDAQASSFDLLQHGAVIVIRQKSPSRLAGIDPTLGTSVPGPEIPSDAQVALGGGTSAMFVPDTGQLFVTPAPNSAAALGFDTEMEATAAGTIDGPGRLAVGVDGLVHLLATETGEINTYGVDGQHLATRVIRGELTDVSLTAVGSMPVAATPSELLIPDRDPIDLSDIGQHVTLQEPGPATGAVLVAAEGTFLEVSLDGGPMLPIEGAGDGVPAPPVHVAGCSYGAWGGDLSWVQLCEGMEPRTGSEPGLEPSTNLRFRVNRDRVTLNNLDTGTQLLFGEEDPIFIDNEWAEALSEEVDEEPEVDEEADVLIDPTCGDENTDPVAEPDRGLFGTRPGRPVIVYPLRNDSDPDCDVLLIESVELSRPDAGSVGIVESGQAVQVELEPGVDSLSFDYTIGDGRGGQASSTVDVAIVPEGENSPPVLSAEEDTTVVTGGTVTHNVLGPAYDPDGDVLHLRSATFEDAAQGSVRFTEKGDITFTATDAVGDHAITYVVSDGESETSGVLQVKVVSRETNQPPNARKESATTFVGREVVMDVLDNDTDPDNDPLSIVRVDADADASVSWDPTSPEIRVVANQAGTVNITYQITDGQNTDEAVFRVDVRDDVENLPPIAVRDDVLLDAGIPAFVPVVENDVDPDGAVLVVLGVDGLPEPSPISVSVLQRSVLKITADTPLAEPVSFRYRISDGSNEAVGQVLVEPSPTDVRNRPPVAVPDEYTVRAGGVVTLPVLANDSDPDADPITVVAPSEDQPDAARQGRLYLSHDDQLRYEAPTTPQSTIKLVYSVADSADNVQSAELTLHILPADENTNEAPVPPELVGRTIAGQTVTVPVPLTSMDPDGDSVTFLGLGENSPSLGTVIEVRPDELVYRADASAAGTDEFTYRVVDTFGQEATGTVLIGVAGRSEVNNAPVAVDDQIAVRPGGRVRIPVLANDLDPDGDPLVVSDAEDHVPLPTEGTAEVDGREIVYTAPDDPEGAETSFRYAADDGRGLARGATVTVTFRTDENNRPPDAIDDVSEPLAPEATVRLDVLSNDDDPDDDELTIVEVSRSGVTIAPDGRSLQIVMGTEPLQFTYLVSDGELTSRAAVFVPVIDPEDNRPPIARLDEAEVDIGESVTIDVLDNDEDPEGADVHLLELLTSRHGSVDFDGEAVTFTASEENYAGDAGFYYLVGDTDDPATAQTAVGAVHVTISGTVNTEPAFTQLSVEVPAGSERPLDLNSGVVDPDEGDEHEFTDLDVEGDGFDVDLERGGAMVVTADSDTPAGTTGVARFTVSDGDAEVDGSVLITVVSSDRPLPVVGADEGETVQTQPVTVDVLANDTNPFPETPLRIIGTDVRQGGGSASVSGSSITYDPGADFFGTATITYTVEDETRDPDRHVEGTLSVNVIGFPDAPPTPTCIGGESRSVRVQWAAPSANGAPITEYVIRVSGAGSGAGDRTVGNASTVDVDGLQNGVEYTFQVGAVNQAVTEAGTEPQFSGVSAPCIPDQVPDQPAAPVTQYGDQQMQISWTAPNNEGSALQKYTLANATTGESQDFGPTVTSHTWPNLDNGTCYRFTLTATNARGDSDSSPLSAGDTQTCVPAGVPQNPSTPTITNNQPGQRATQINVAWTWNNSTQGNGDNVTTFRVTPYRNGVAQTPKVINDGTARSTSFSVTSADYGTEYRFTLEAQNKAGWSAPSSQSSAIVPADVPGAPSQPSGVPEPNSGQVQLSFSTPPDNGAAITGYQVSVNSGGWQSLASNRVVSGLNNGTGYRFAVRALNSEGAGPASPQSASVVPFGKIGTPTNLRGSNSGNTLNWNWGAPSLNGHNSVDRYQVSINGGGWSNVGGARSHSMNVPDGECRNLRVRAIGDRQGSGDDRHISNAAGPAQACAPAPPPRRTIASWSGAYTPCDSNPSSTCQWGDVRVENFAPGSYSIQCHSREAGHFLTSSRAMVVGSDGRGRVNRVCHAASGNTLWYVIDGVASNRLDW